MNNIKEAKNSGKFEYDVKNWNGRYNETDDAKALIAWIHDLPAKLKELGFKRIKSIRRDATSIQAEFDIEPAYDVIGPYQKQFYQDLFDEILPIAEKAFSRYLPDATLEAWENLDESAKEAKLKDIVELRARDREGYWEALEHYCNRYPEGLPILSKCVEHEYHWYKDEEHPLYIAYIKDDRNASNNLRFEYLKLVFTLKRTENNTVYYDLTFNGDSWQGTTVQELEADWDDFLVNSFGNYLGA